MDKHICWYCSKEIDVNNCEDVEFSWEFDTYFHLSCLSEACKNYDGEDPELHIFVEEMNEKGYEFSMEGD